MGDKLKSTVNDLDSLESSKFFSSLILSSSKAILFKICSLEAFEFPDTLSFSDSSSSHNSLKVSWQEKLAL